MLILLSSQLVLAEVNIKDKSVNSIVIKELSLPAKFELTIDNDNSFREDFVIDTLLDIKITPRNLGSLSARQIKTFEIEVAPSERMKEVSSGRVSFEYFVKGTKAGVIKDTLTIELLTFEEVIDIILPTSVESEEEFFTVDMKFNKNLELDAIVNVDSELFSDSFEITLSNESKEASFDIDLSDKTAGVYEVSFNFEINNESVTVVKDLILGSIIDIGTEEIKSGKFLSREIKIIKTNNGNSVTEVSITVEKSSLASLFTSFTGAPTTKKEGGKYIYEWSEDLNPGEELEVTVKTSYYLPFIVLLLILAAIGVFKIVTNPSVKISKKVIRVRTKSGVFASKIIVSIKNTGKPISNVKVIERLPVFTEILKDKFGVVTPSEIKKRSVIWDFEKLGTGEELMFSYVIYSKVEVFGKLEVPAAVVTYRDNKDEFKEEHSNKIYILSEEKKRSEEF